MTSHRCENCFICDKVFEMLIAWGNIENETFNETKMNKIPSNEQWSPYRYLFCSENFCIKIETNQI